MSEHLTSKEHRLALVLNGGVSLAIWMAGVVYEIDLLRRAAQHWGPLCRSEAEEPGTKGSGDRGSGGGGRGHNVTVDIIAGTSAGGLNGALLATAIARDSSLCAPGGSTEQDENGTPWLRRLWLEAASLVPGKLLPPPGERKSLLDGDYFHDVILQALRDLGAPDDPPPEPGRSQEQGQDQGPEQSQDPVTLFLTATAFGRSDHSFVDAFGSPFQVPDHRRLYRFERAQDRFVYQAPEPGLDEALADDASLDEYFSPDTRDDFSQPDTGQAIASAARASASFPVAFSPVEAYHWQGEPEAPVAESRLGTPVEWLMDGGILDNAPFGPVLDAVTRRSANEPVDRLVVYVVPANGTPAVQPMAAPGFPSWYRVAASSIGLASESDLRSDIEQLRALLSAHDDDWLSRQRLFASLLSDPQRRKTHTRAAKSLLPEYRRSQVLSGVRQAQLWCGKQSPAGTTSPPGTSSGGESVAGPAAGHPATPLTPTQSLSEADLATILANRPLWAPPSDAAVDRPQNRTWWWGPPAAERIVRLLARHLRGQLDGAGAQQEQPHQEQPHQEQPHQEQPHQRADQEADQRPDQRAQELRHAVSDIDRQLRRIIAVRDAVEQRLREIPPEVLSDGQSITKAINGPLAELHVPRVLCLLVSRAVRIFARAVGSTPIDTLSSALAVEVIAHGIHDRGWDQRSAAFRFLRLGPDVAVPALDSIDPGASMLAGRLGAGKLFGTQVAHFGAFGRPEWRDWDWLCGRLDAIAHLAPILSASPDQIAAAQCAVLKQEGLVVEEYHQRLLAMSSVDLLALHQDLTRDQAGQQSLAHLGDHVVGMLDATVSERSPALAGWLRAIVARDVGESSLDPAQRSLRWFVAPTRERAYRRWFPGASTDNCPAPWPLAIWTWGALAVAIALGTGTAWSLASTGHPVAATLIAGVGGLLLGSVLTALGTVVGITVLRQRAKSR